MLTFNRSDLFFRFNLMSSDCMVQSKTNSSAFLPVKESGVPWSIPQHLNCSYSSSAPGAGSNHADVIFFCRGKGREPTEPATMISKLILFYGTHSKRRTLMITYFPLQNRFITRTAHVLPHRQPQLPLLSPGSLSMTQSRRLVPLLSSSHLTSPSRVV